MLEVFWACLIGGAIFTLIQVIFGDLFDFGGHVDADAFSAADGVDALHGADAIGHLEAPNGIEHAGGTHVSFFNGTTIVAAISVFGGVGVLLTRFAAVAALPAAALAIGIAFLLAVAMHFLWIKPLRQSETSVGYSDSDCVGRIAEVSIPIPDGGYGQVMINIAGTNTIHIAAACDPGDVIPVGEKVVVVEVKDQTLYVSPYQE